MKIQLKDQLPVQMNNNHIPKSLHKELKNMLKIFSTGAGLIHQNPTTLHQL